MTAPSSSSSPTKVGYCARGSPTAEDTARGRCLSYLFPAGWPHGQNSPHRFETLMIVEHDTKISDKKTPVDDRTFTVDFGVVTGFVGPNGAATPTTKARVRRRVIRQVVVLEVAGRLRDVVEDLGPGDPAGSG